MTDDKEKTGTADITLADVIDMINLIDVIVERGGLRGEEVAGVGSLREHLLAFANQYDFPQEMLYMNQNSEERND